VTVVTVVGARPQFIKAAPVSAAFREHGIEQFLVHTGQHYDDEMSRDFFVELGLPEPDVNLGVGSGSHAVQTARMLEGMEQVILDRRPPLVVVFGDTNSTLAGALAGAKLAVPVAHVEAGLRSFDPTMPEEVNRVLTDHLARLLFSPTPTATSNLAAEGLTEGVHEVGDVMADVLLGETGRTRPAGALSGPYVVATVHRAATTDDPARLGAAVDLLLHLGLRVVFPVHPRTRQALERADLLADLDASPDVQLLAPQGHREMAALVASARAVVTDSGGLQKEAYILGVPCITLRTETEWVETVAAGWNILVDLDRAAAVAALDRVPPDTRPALYGDGQASRRIAEAVREFLAGGRAGASSA
jgi:UDP-GlcNAc3NAcA epimerase